MVNFALKCLFDIKGRIPFYQLVVDGSHVLDDFISSLNENENNDISSIKLYMETVSSLKLLPRTKFRDITPKGEKFKEYEFKKNRIRIYCIKISSGQVVILCGYKGNQKNDINNFRKIKKKFISQYEKS